MFVPDFPVRSRVRLKSGFKDVNGKTGTVVAATQPNFYLVELDEEIGHLGRRFNFGAECLELLPSILEAERLWESLAEEPLPVLPEFSATKEQLQQTYREMVLGELIDAVAKMGIVACDVSVAGTFLADDPCADLAKHFAKAQPIELTLSIDGEKIGTADNVCHTPEGLMMDIHIDLGKVDDPCRIVRGPVLLEPDPDDPKPDVVVGG